MLGLRVWKLVSLNVYDLTLKLILHVVHITQELLRVDDTIIILANPLILSLIQMIDFIQILISLFLKSFYIPLWQSDDVRIGVFETASLFVLFEDLLELLKFNLQKLDLAFVFIPHLFELIDLHF